MDKVSILIPARGERWSNLKRTIESIYENATGEIEIIVGIDGVFGHWGTGEELELTFNDINLHDHFPDVKVIPFPSVVGIKTNINAMAAMATGKYIYKSDAHCRLSKGFDEVLKADMEDDWIVMPRFKIINENWEIQMRDDEEEYYDYFYLCCPFTDPKGFRFKAGGHWKEKTKQFDPDDLFANVDDNGINRFNYIDETPQIHGSGWFMTKDRFFELGGFPNIDPYGHAQEPIWLAMKNWMAGGKVMVNKKCWYAHLHQQGNKRGYHMDKAQENRSYALASEYFVGDKWDDTWPEKKMTFEQFVEKFMPMPTWPENYKELISNYQNEQNIQR